MGDQARRCAYPEISAILLLVGGLTVGVGQADADGHTAVDHTVTIRLLGEDDSLLGEATFYVCGLCELLLANFFPVEYVKSVKLRLPKPELSRSERALASQDMARVLEGPQREHWAAVRESTEAAKTAVMGGDSAGAYAEAELLLYDDALAEDAERFPRT